MVGGFGGDVKLGEGSRGAGGHGSWGIPRPGVGAGPGAGGGARGLAKGGSLGEGAGFDLDRWGYWGGKLVAFAGS